MEHKTVSKRSNSTPAAEDASEGATKYVVHLCTETEVFGFISKIMKPRTWSLFIKEIR
jgi:hypothetical protein